MTDIGRVYRHVVSEEPSAGVHLACMVMDEPSTPSTTQRAVMAAARLQALFDRYPDLERVAVFVGETAIGVALRADYPATTPEPPSPTPSDGRVGQGDRAVLPGRSQRYEAFRYTCPRCSRAVYTTADQAPLCPHCQVPTS
ncbi:hypothetical protein GCM10010252_63590 [Streptomyces aureoverticillatus]|nr:hypothetical protein GCM10010252_63590 [Streptomyces aureoverticillatus]